jgi:two-component system chemotaxis response regulator CheB
VIGVGGSTGGAAALETLLRSLPAGIPAAVLAVHHMPPGFSPSFARYLDTVSAVPVTEGREGEPVKPRHAYLAAGGVHLRLQRGAEGPVLRLDAVSPAQGGYRPSINALFCSVAAAEKERAIGVLLSGMGEDGVAGLAAIRKVGGCTFVQDEETSVVYGMAERAVAAGVVDHVVPLGALSSALGRAASGTYREVFT